MRALSASATRGASTFVHAAVVSKGELLRLLAHIGADCNCGNSRSCWCVQRCATSRERTAGTALSTRRTRSAESALCGGIDATLALAARSVVGSRGAGERSAARHFSQTGVSLERGSGQPRQTTERPSGRRRSRTGGRLRVSPLTRCRATLKLTRYHGRTAANFVPPEDRREGPKPLSRRPCATSRQPSLNTSRRRTSVTMRRQSSTMRSADARCSLVSSSSCSSCASARRAASGLLMPC